MQMKYDSDGGEVAAHAAPTHSAQSHPVHFHTHGHSTARLLQPQTATCEIMQLIQTPQHTLSCEWTSQTCAHFPIIFFSEHFCVITPPGALSETRRRHATHGNTSNILITNIRHFNMWSCYKMSYTLNCISIRPLSPTEMDLFGILHHWNTHSSKWGQIEQNFCTVLNIISERERRLDGISIHPLIHSFIYILRYCNLELKWISFWCHVSDLHKNYTKYFPLHSAFSLE